MIDPHFFTVHGLDPKSFTKAFKDAEIALGGGPLKIGITFTIITKDPDKLWTEHTESPSLQFLTERAMSGLKAHDLKVQKNVCKLTADKFWSPDDKAFVRIYEI